MTEDAAGRWQMAAKAAALFAVAPRTLGGIHARARPGPILEAWLELLGEFLGDIPTRRIPASVTPDRLLGGLDLAMTLSAGTPVYQKGLLSECDGGVVIAPMAERMTADTASHLSHALDEGVVRLERDGLSEISPAEISLIALDEGAEPDEHISLGLQDRLAISIDLDGIALRDMLTDAPDLEDVLNARSSLADVEMDAQYLSAINGLAQSFGIRSLRPVLFALQIAKIGAALSGRLVVTDDDVILATTLVLAPRAVQWPAPQEETPPDQPPPPEENDDQDPGDGRTQDMEQPLEDMILAAAAAVMPPDVLAKLQAAQAGALRGANEGRAGAVQISKKRGRPAGVRSGTLAGGDRLNVLETLRAAAPWQRLRGGGPGHDRIMVRSEDFRVNRFKHRTETTAIFVVDASGSSALNRLAEVKGAVELLLAECYVRRDEVALIAFRNTEAEIILPPTRSLLRAKRQLAGLPGGGGTPLAKGLESAMILADGVRRKGRHPVVVVLTDGSANIGRDGNPGRAQAQADAKTSARLLRAAGVPGIWIDTAPRPQQKSREIAQDMDATYLPLPRAGANALAETVDAAMTGRAG